MYGKAVQLQEDRSNVVPFAGTSHQHNCECSIKKKATIFTDAEAYHDTSILICVHVLFREDTINVIVGDRTASFCFISIILKPRSVLLHKRTAFGHILLLNIIRLILKLTVLSLKH